MKRCFIFGALEVNELSVKPSKGDMVIAADRGFETTKKFGIVPDLLVGDFDSLGYTPEFENIVRLNVRKDDTDVGHAVDTAMRDGYYDFVVYGGSGGKLDHSVANIQLASAIANAGGRAVFLGENESFTVICNGSVKFGDFHRGRISVFSLSEKSFGVCEKGLSFPLTDAELDRNNPLGVSNEFTGVKSEISVRDGTLLIIWQRNLMP
ncbi:MAG: thiamine diphosphokinase [Acutalibacteraceae bacterium]